MKSVICMSYCKPGLGDPLTPLVNLIVNLSTTEVYIYMAFFSTRRLAHIWSARRDLTANKRRAALERRHTGAPPHSNALAVWLRRNGARQSTVTSAHTPRAVFSSHAEAALAKERRHSLSATSLHESSTHCFSSPNLPAHPIPSPTPPARPDDPHSTPLTRGS